jgi:hypothetical protein
MTSAAFKALGDLLSKDFRSVLLKATAMTLALFVAILVGVEVLLSYLMVIPWPWLKHWLRLAPG